MATVKVIGQIKTTLAKSLAYISRPDATTDGLWVSTNAAVIDPSDFKAVARQMSDTVERVGVTKPRAGSVLAHHIVQSFDPKEAMSAEVAHRLGVQLAEQMTGGTHEYMIATHQDKGHLHNHIIFNAVNFQTGRKFRMLNDSESKFRAMSDELCKVAGLSVLPPYERGGQHSTRRSLAETNLILKGESFKEHIRTEIDRAVAKASSWGEFEQLLFKAGVETSVRGGRNSTLAFRQQRMKRPIRDWRLGAAYTEGSIMARMSRSVVNMVTVDASMIVKESTQTLTVIVPGTRREVQVNVAKTQVERLADKRVRVFVPHEADPVLGGRKVTLDRSLIRRQPDGTVTVRLPAEQRQMQMTVAKTQVVRAGRALRVYVPTQDSHALATTDGTYARTVTTAGLYDYFAKPDIASVVKGSKDKELAGTFQRWDSGLKELRELGERVNAKARYMRSGQDAETGLAAARERLVEQHDRYQTTLVALAEMTAAPAPDVVEIRVLTAELHSVERALETVKSDVRALTQLTQQEAKMEVSDRIATQIAQAKNRATAEQEARTERTAQRARLKDQADDRETPAQQEQKEAAQTGVDEHYEDQAHDREAAQQDENAPKTLAERLAERQAALRNNTSGRDSDGPTQGRNR